MVLAGVLGREGEVDGRRWRGLVHWYGGGGRVAPWVGFEVWVGGFLARERGGVDLRDREVVVVIYTAHANAPGLIALLTLGSSIY